MNKIKTFFVNHKKYMIICITFIVIIGIVLGINETKKEKREWAINHALSFTKIDNWYNKDDAINNVRVILKHLYDFKIDKNNFYKKRLTNDDIEEVLYQYYISLIEFDLSQEEVDKILLFLFKEENSEQYNSFDNYTKYIGEKAYYENNNYNSNNARFNISIFDDSVKIKKINFFEDEDDYISTVHYKIILKDNNLKILDVIEYDGYEKIYNFDEYINLEIKNVKEVDYYIIACS